MSVDVHERSPSMRPGRSTRLGPEHAVGPERSSRHGTRPVRPVSHRSHRAWDDRSDQRLRARREVVLCATRGFTDVIALAARTGRRYTASAFITRPSSIASTSSPSPRAFRRRGLRALTEAEAGASSPGAGAETRHRRHRSSPTPIHARKRLRDAFARRAQTRRRVVVCDLSGNPRVRGRDETVAEAISGPRRWYPAGSAGGSRQSSSCSRR
jgi:hypothetical protein